MRIRCPQCKRFFDYEPANGPARCPHEGCGWSFGESAAQSLAAGPSVESRTPGYSQVSTQLTSAGPGGKTPLPAGERLPSRKLKNLWQSPGGTILCPGCRARIPDSSAFCPVCGVDLASAFSESEGIRAVFDVSGDITFTPRMVVFLFLSTLAAFLAFSWILSNRGKEETYVPLVITDPEIKEGGVNRPLQGVTFSDLKQEFLNPGNTDLRREALVRKFTGQRVIWPGLIKKITNEDKAYRVDIIMEGVDSRSFVTLQALKLPSNERLIANLSRGQNILFSGKIAGFDTGGPGAAFDYFLIELGDGIILK